MHRVRVFVSLAMLLFVPLLGCTQSSTPSPGSTVTPKPGGKLRLATTTSTYDTGLLDTLLPPFEQANNCKVDVLSKGTGEALKLGEKGDADVVLVHARAKEDEFVKNGFGVNRRDVMYNDFVIVGPPNDPAGIKSAKDTVEAFQKIASTKANFVSRGDGSGTETKEKSIWTKAGITPSGDWYKSIGKGMGDTLTMTNEILGYTVSDRGTFLAYRGKLELVILLGGNTLAENKDKDLLNYYGVIAVNPEKCPGVNSDMAMKFIDYICGEQGQKIIAEFGKDKYGQPLFYPNAKP